MPEWIECSVYGMPLVDPTARTEVKLRNGATERDLTVRSWDWNDYGCQYAIVAYRLLEGEQDDI